MKLIKNHKGSIVLITVLVVSAVLLIVILGASESQITTSYQQLNTVSNKSTYYFAESCMEEAMGKIKMDSSYLGGTIILDDDNTSCDIVVTGGSPKTIDITINYGNYTQSFEGEISVTTSGQANNVRLLNWNKI